MDTVTSFFSNKRVLLGIGGVGAILLLKHFQNSQQKEEDVKKRRFGPLLSPFIQRCFFGFTCTVWLIQLNQTLIPRTSTFLSKTLRSLYPLLPLYPFNKSSINLFTKKRGLIAVGISMALLTAYRKNSTCHSLINKILMNPISFRMYEFTGYSMPWIVMIKCANSNTIKSFKYFMAWFSIIFISNGLSLGIGGPIFSFLKIRHIPYFSLLSYSFGLLSPNANISETPYLSYLIISGVSKMFFIAYKLGFDSGNVRFYSALANIFIPLPYLYFNSEIALQIAVFYWIPNVYYFYYVMGHPEITEIVKGVYLANMAAVNAENIKKYEIQSIVELHDKYKNVNRFESVNYLSIEIGDRSFIPINEKFDETNEFIAKCVEQNVNVVCHCSAGVSRSATIVTAYLIYSGYSFDAAVAQMKKLRTSFDPNTGYLAQLKAFSANNGG